MALLRDLFGIGYVDPRLEMDSNDATTANVRAEMQPGKVEQFLGSREGQQLLFVASLLTGKAPTAAPLRTAGTQALRETAFQRPRTMAEVGDQLPLPLADANIYPTTAPRPRNAATPPDVVQANLAEAQKAAAAIKELGYEPVIMPKGDNGSVYLRVLKDGEDLKFKGRFADHAQGSFSSISADPASANTAADVVRAFRYHAGLDKSPPEVGWSQLRPRGANQASIQRGGIGVYDTTAETFRGAAPIRKTVRLFQAGIPAAVAAGSAGDVTTEDIANAIRGRR